MMTFPIYGKNKKCSKPPIKHTSYICEHYQTLNIYKENTVFAFAWRDDAKKGYAGPHIAFTYRPYQRVAPS